MKRIVALDPGGTTGWACWQDEPIVYAEQAPPWDHFTVGQIGPEEHHKALYDLLGFLQVHDFTLISESFEFRQDEDGGPRHGLNLISREYIGVAKLFAAERMKRPVVLQTAGLAKGFIPDKPRDGLAANEKLKALGLWVPGKKHSMDAMRHLVWYLVNRERMTSLIKPWKDL